MDICLVWTGSGKVIVGDHVEQVGEQVTLASATEVKNTVVQTPYGLQEVAQLLSLVPLSTRCVDITIKADLVLMLNADDELSKAYREYRAKSSGIVTDINNSVLSLDEFRK